MDIPFQSGLRPPRRISSMATTSPRSGASGHLAADVGGHFAADVAIRQMPDVPPKKIFSAKAENL